MPLNSLAVRTRSLYDHQNPSQIAAMSKRFPADTCNGDSGGPLACNVTGQWLIVGILSGGQKSPPGFTEECMGFEPEVYSRVSFYTEFFEGTGTFSNLSSGVRRCLFTRNLELNKVKLKEEK